MEDGRESFTGIRASDHALIDTIVSYCSRSVYLRLGHSLKMTDTRHNRATTALELFERGQLPEALSAIDAAIAAAPGLTGAYNTRGLILAALNDGAGAVAAYSRVLAEMPHHADALTNRGSALLKLGQYDTAMIDLEAAAAAHPAYATAHFNLARGYAVLSRVDDALASYDRALVLSPGDAKTLWAKGVVQLLGGDFAEGWVNYNSRWQAPSFGNSAPRDFGVRYTGAEPLSGRTLFVHAEQGFGDTIQFCRYIPLLAAQGARVLFMAQPELIGLLTASELPCTLYTPGASMPRFDYHIPLLNLPAALKTTLSNIPTDVPYLATPPEKQARWNAVLGVRTRPRIGIAWSGRRSHCDDHLRSMAVEAFAPLFALDAELHVLQTDLTDAERAFLTDKARIFDVADRDFGDAAAHVAAMDHVLTVDTSLGHLAGALAKPVSILLSAAPDFRWMLERSDSPWYPTARLIRQSAFGRWDDAIAAALKILKETLL